ncbi:M23 family metallopeptidase [Bdellovibrionota bacterium FG-2]
MFRKRTKTGFSLLLAALALLPACDQDLLSTPLPTATATPAAAPSSTQSNASPKPGTKKLEITETPPSPRPNNSSNNNQESNCKSYPFVPDTSDSPSLVFKWDYPVNSTNLTTVGVFGVMENGGGKEEVATETELHLTKSHDSIYALSDGIVIQIQSAIGPVIDPGEVEGVLVRYGKNFLIKYVHVRNPVVQLGQQIKMGELIGSTIMISPNTPSEYGFYEVETRIKESDGVYAYPMYNFLDASSKALFDGWWADAKIWRDSLAKNPFKAKDKEDITQQMDPCFFQ